MIEVVRAPAHLVLQDFGFEGFRNIGLPRSGAMDRGALERGNSLVGNSPGQVAFEWAVSGGALAFHVDAEIALTGAVVRGRLGQIPLAAGKMMSVKAGTTLEIDRFGAGRFVYLCVSPAPNVPLTFGSRSTYTPAEIGGFRGRRLRTGDMIDLAATAEFSGAAAFPATNLLASAFRIVPGPQGGVLEGRLLEYLLNSEFLVSPNSDRTGYRLEGPPLETTGLPQILSEPACEGAIQVTDSGIPIVLMADGPTIGGYNKVAVVIGDDLDRLAQKSPGERIRFALKAG